MAIDYAKEGNYTEIVELLSKNPKQQNKVKNIDENQQLKKEIALLRIEVNTLKKENAALYKEVKLLKEKNIQITEKNEITKKENADLQKGIQRLKEKNNEMTEQNKTYTNFLFSLKEKQRELTFFDQKDYEEVSVIKKNVSSTVKIVSKKEKYVMKETLLFDHKSKQRFLGGCELLFKLRHPCIIRVYGFNLGDETHKPSIILSFEPKSLEAAIKNDELNNEEKNRITVEFVLGMRHIHKHKLMHRDLKPSNILLSKNNHVRITDFGLAKEEDDFETTQSKGVGTLLFMAPELFDDENETNYTGKVDVYSFGVILIFIVTNKYPKKIKGTFPKLPENITKWVRELIDQCLLPKPENRPSFAEIFEILKANNYDLFGDNKNKKTTRKNSIESRIMKIEAFEYQHQ